MKTIKLRTKKAPEFAGYSAGALTLLDLVERGLAYLNEPADDIRRAVNEALREAPAADAADLEKAAATLDEIRRLYARLGRQLRPVMERTAPARVMACSADEVPF